MGRCARIRYRVMMECKTITRMLCLILAYVVILNNCQILEDDMPREISECIQRLTQVTNSSDVTYIPPSTVESIHVHCIQEFMWKFGDVQWEMFNISEKDQKFVNSLIASLVRHGRNKRQVGPVGGIFPLTGFRIRREYRRLTDGQRFMFHETLRQMKAIGQYDVFARMHSGVNVNSAHNGPNFPGWHRVYLSLFEEAMRRIRPAVTLPYWDSSLDNDMPNPVDSIIWTESFLGNGNGIVTTGPFTPWVIDGLELVRNIGSGSRLFTKEIIARILTRCRNIEILTPNALPDFDFEFHHGGPHIWVGGHMAFLNTAAFDPVFFMHHAFVDYIWELFRIRQARFCGINPESDYPAGPGSTGLHAPGRPMDGFPQYRNIDGYRNYWTQFWYRYERSPTCSTWSPFCGTPYLRCDVARQRCVSVERMGPSPVAAGAAGFAGAMEPGTIASNMRARVQESMIMAGPKFRAPPPEPRTQDAQMGMAAMAGRRRRAVESPKNENITVTIGEGFPKQDGISFERQFSTSQSVTESLRGPGLNTGDKRFRNNSIAEGHAFPEAEPMPLLPLPEYHDTSINDLLKPHVENDFVINGRADKSQWSFVPVKIIYTKHQGLYRERTSSMSEQSTASFPRKCIQDQSGAIQVKVQSYGISYSGNYINFALIDKHLPIDSAITYVGVKTPGPLNTKVIFAAVHSCGTMCQPYCVVPNSNPRAFEPCTGMLRISPDDPSAYGPTVEDTAARTWHGDFSTDLHTTNIHILFHCSDPENASSGNSPWLANMSTNYTSFLN